MKSVRRLVVLLGVLIGVGLALAPYVYTEAMPQLAKRGWPIAPESKIRDGALPGPMAGTVVGDRWRVQQIGPGTYALGEPAGDPDNYEYLLVGETRALLIDAGSTAEDIHSVLETLTKLPVTVMPSHLHYDHSNGLRNFRSIALLDVPETRARVQELAAELLQGRTVLLITHDPMEACRLGHSLVVLSGHPAVLGPPIVVPGRIPRALDDPDLLRTQGHLMRVLTEADAG